MVAPDREQSGVGTALTLHAPIRARAIPPMAGGSTGRVTAYSVDGTPGDCSVLALEHLVGPVGLLVSGINQGSNLGEDVLISGTVGAALQGFVRGYPSIAISVAAIKDTRFDVASAFLKLLGRRLSEGVSLPPSLINVNIPNEPSKRVKGVAVTRLGRRSYRESVKEGDDGRHGYFWISRDRPVVQEQQEGTDIWALGRNLISVTPIGTGLTDLGMLPELERLFKEFPSHILGGA